MSTTKTLILSVCPVCGTEPTAYAMRNTRHGTQYAIGCTRRSCNTNTTFMSKTLETMAERWNSGIGLVRGGIPIANTSKRQMVAVTVRI